MRRAAAIATLLAAAALVQCRREEPQRYVIEAAADSCAMVCLMVNGEVVDSASVSHGVAMFRGDLVEPTFGCLACRCEGKLTLLADLFLENGRIEVRGGAARGTPANEAFRRADSLLRSIAECYYSANLSDRQRDSIARSEEELHRLLVDENRDNIFGVYHFYTEVMHSLDADEIERETTLFTPELQRSSYIARARKHAEELRHTSPGRKFREVELPDTAGRSVKLSSAVAANRAVLVYFWASWCGPCMRALPELAGLYGEFRGRGFEIYGISLDNNAAAWSSAAEMYGMSWLNTSDLQGWHSLPAEKYGVLSIPANILIGHDGTILARNLRCEALREQLDSLLAQH